jgi:hypothetical protein
MRAIARAIRNSLWIRGDAIVTGEKFCSYPATFIPPGQINDTRKTGKLFEAGVGNKLLNEKQNCFAQ